jgi:hypothetical protein
MTLTIPTALSLSPIFRTRAAVEAAIIPAPIYNISVDGLGYRRTTLGNALQSGDGDWWEPSDIEVYPEHFGANANGAECGAELTTYFNYLRSSEKTGRGNAGVYDHGTTTLYIGAVRFDGAGGPQNLSNAGLSRTAFTCDANPAGIAVTSPTTTTTFHECHFTNCGFLAKGGTVAALDLPTYPAFPKQVGLILGRNPAYAETVTGGEAAGVGGAGGAVFHNVTLQDFSGWGIIGYKWWGKSSSNEIFIRRCGGQGAYELSDDTACGGIWLLSGSVDLRFGNIHMFNGNYTNTLHDQRGTGIRIGDTKAAHSATDSLFDPSTYIILSGIHTEGFVYPLNLYAGKAVFIHGCNFKGPSAGTGILRVGCGTSGDNDVKVMFGNNKLFDIARIQVTHGGVDLGEIYNQEQNTAVIVEYWSSLTFSGQGGGSTATGVANHKLTFTPNGDTTEMPSGTGTGSGARNTANILPYVETEYEPTDVTHNLISRFATTDGGALVNWVQTSGLVTATKTWSLRVKDDNALGSGNDGIATLTMAGLTVGQLYTCAFYVDMLATSHFLGDISFSVNDGSSDLIPEKALGDAGAAGDGTVAYRIFNFIATATTCYFVFKNKDGNDIQLNNLYLVPGTMRHTHYKKWPNVWCSADAGWVTCV